MTQPIFRFYRNPLDPLSPELSLEFYNERECSWSEVRMSFTDALRFCQRLSAEIVSIILNNPKMRDKVVVRDVDVEVYRPTAQQDSYKSKRGLLARILGR